MRAHAAGQGPSFNDAKVNRNGAFFAGTTDRLECEPIGQLFSLEPACMPRLLAEGSFCSNGPSFSPSGRLMYHTRSHDRERWAYETGEGGTIGRGELFAWVGADEGIPDGSTVDAEGHLWSTHWDGVRITRYRPDGCVERIVEDETGFAVEPTAGGILAFEPGVEGLPEPAFPG